MIIVVLFCSKVSTTKKFTACSFYIYEFPNCNSTVAIVIGHSHRHFMDILKACYLT